MNFADPIAATRFRDAVRDICRDILKIERPSETYATVIAIDRVFKKCTVRFPGETVDVVLPMGAIQPMAVGETVRVKGLTADRHVEAPVTGQPHIANAPMVGARAAREALTDGNNDLVVGMSFWEVDFKLLWMWDGTNWIVPYPLGRIGLASITSNSAAFTSIIYPLTLSNVPILANRKIRVHVHTNVYCASAPVHIAVAACDANGTIASQAYRVISSGGLAEQITVDWRFTQVAATSFGCRIGAYAGISSLLTAHSTYPTYLAVYDEGPA